MASNGNRKPKHAVLRLLADLAADPGSNPSAAKLSRRGFLQVGSAAALASVLAPVTSRSASRRSDPKIVIVGAGLAGLVAATALKKAGISSEIYEASPRSGGRIFSVQDAMGHGLVTEFGGEFIDRDHKDLLGLAKELGLEVLDRHNSSDPNLIPKTYYFGGKTWSEKELVEAFKPFIGTITRDSAVLAQNPTFENPANASALDNTSLSAYLDGLRLPKWLHDLLRVAYVTEFGLEAEEQSALNFLSIFPTIDSQGSLEFFGEGAERFKIAGGNEQIVKALSAPLQSRIHLSQTLRSIKPNAKGYILTFGSAGGSMKDVSADIILLTIPFSVLRKIEISVDLPPWKTKAINELGYGTNTKVMIGFSRRVWHDDGYGGEAFSDEAYQLAWDNSELQAGDAGGLTVFTGGTSGVDAGRGTLAERTDAYLPGLEKTFPGLTARRNHHDRRMHWPSYEYSLGSYAAYKVGQWTTIRGAEIKPVGNLFFAGEHCSLEFQGYMNGAAQTGRVAAEAIVKAVG